MKKLIPLLIAIFCVCNSYASFAQNIELPTIRKIVIDPGHGGNDPGALSPDRKLREKDINLAVAKYLGREIKSAYPDVEVIYTRTTDKNVALDYRGTLATEQHADLFISIHVNSAKKAVNGAVGPETWVFGRDRSLRKDDSYDIVLQENEVIKFEKDYRTKYEKFDPDNPQSMIVFNFQIDAIMRQSKILGMCCQQALRKGPLTGVAKDRGLKEGGLMVLAYCSMPAILVELGFINSAADRKIMATDSGRKKLAHSLFLGFEQYLKDYQQHTSNLVNTSSTSENAPIVDSVPNADSSEEIPSSVVSGKEFRVQILSLKQSIKTSSKEFKGHSEVQCVVVDNQTYKYKYTLGSFTTLEKAQEYCNRLRAGDFPQAFVIAVENGKLVPTK